MPQPGRQTTDILGRWHDAAKVRYEDLLKEHDPPWLVPLGRNHYTLSYVIRGTAMAGLSMADLLSAARRTNTNVRDVVWTGWSMFYPFTRREIEPYTFHDPQLEEDVLETNLMVDRILDTTLPDFWRLAPSGKAALSRAYREDRSVREGEERKPGAIFSPTQLAQELTELVMHAHGLAQQFPGAEVIAFRMEWVGLKDRLIWDQEADKSIERKSRSDRRVVSFEAPVSDLPARWPDLVAQAATQVVRLFDPSLELDADWVRRVSPKFRRL